MCGRYVCPDDAAIERGFKLVRHDWRFPPRFSSHPPKSCPSSAPPLAKNAIRPRRWKRSIKANVRAVDSYVHATMPADDLMRHIHNAGNNPHRMPAILRREDQCRWLNGSVDEARAVLAQYDLGSMLAHVVTTTVDSPENNDPALIEAV